MSFRFELSPDFEKQIAREVATKVQQIIDPIQRRYRGQSVDEITPVLKRELDRIGASLSTAELVKYATAINQGVPIRTRGVTTKN